MQKYDFKTVDQLPIIEELPDVMEGVSSPEEWLKKRDYIKAMLSHYLLGFWPDSPAATGDVLKEETIYDGAAIRADIRLNIGNGEHFDFYTVRPNRPGKFPAVVWTYFSMFPTCPVGKELAERGYVLAAFDYACVCPDDPANPNSPAKRAYPDTEWAAIMMWAWGFSKVADYLITTDYTDPERLICTGHSRNGKAALAAGAYDERFKVVAPINSGCGGAGCFRFLGDAKQIIQDSSKVESMGGISHRFPHWFSKNILPFGSDAAPYPLKHENRLPFDLHFLKALVAPRGLITIEGISDVWSNTYGTYLTRLACQPVFDLMDAPGRNLQIIREGGHAHAARDWLWTIEFAEAVFEGRF